LPPFCGFPADCAKQTKLLMHIKTVKGIMQVIFMKYAILIAKLEIFFEIINYFSDDGC
jgi:hypothetical protein